MSSPLPEAVPATETALFKRALSRFATGVTVITTRTDPATAPGGNPQGFVGLTASSFNSVSLEPALVVWSLGLRTRSLPAFMAGSHYVVNVLAADQMALCERFAYHPGDRFEDTDFQLGARGLPILTGALAWFECRHRQRYEEGDHLLFVGEVERCGLGPAHEPLVYQGSAFHTLQGLPQPVRG